MMTSVGQVPVSLSREVPGFALNRLQYAVLNESVNLVADGLLSAEDLDVVVRHGLGLRYAFMGEISATARQDISWTWPPLALLVLLNTDKFTINTN